MSTMCTINHIEKLIDHYQRYEDTKKLSEKIIKSLPGPFTGVVFEKHPFISALPPEIPVISKRASNERLREAVRYLVKCYLYAGVRRDIPIDLIELALGFKQETDKQPVSENLAKLIRELTGRVVDAFRRQGLNCERDEALMNTGAGEFIIHDTLFTVSVTRDDPSPQQTLMLLLNFFLYREDYPYTRVVGVINPVTGYQYTLPVMGVSKELAYPYSLLRDIIAR